MRDTSNPRPETPVTGQIIRVNGPIVEARGLRRAGMLDVVEVGELILWRCELGGDP